MNKEDNVNSLAHTKWNCKCHIYYNDTFSYIVI